MFDEKYFLDIWYCKTSDICCLRIFGKKDKGLKSRSGGFVTAPLSAQPHFGETEMVQVDLFLSISHH